MKLEAWWAGEMQTPGKEMPGQVQRSALHLAPAWKVMQSLHSELGRLHTVW
jgi:hypothetical protein